MSTSRKRELSGSTVDDPLSEEQHEAQDDRVIDDTEHLVGPLKNAEADAKFVKALGRLVKLVAFNANSIDTPYMKTDPNDIATILQHERVRNTVEQAWREQKFKAIRMIREQFPKRFSAPTHQSSGTSGRKPS